MDMPCALLLHSGIVADTEKLADYLTFLITAFQKILEFHSYLPSGFLISMALQTLNDKELEALKELQVLTSDLHVDEDTLIRFLRARDVVPTRAENMLRRHMEWRDANNLESLSKWEVPIDILKEIHVYFTGRDIEGFPVYLMPLGSCDGRKLLGKGLKEEAIKFMYLTLELIMANCKRLGVTKFSVIVDNEGLTLWKCVHWDSIESIIRVIKDFESNYPETLLNAYLVNTPTVFWQAFKFVKPILAGNTLAKIHIFDHDKKSWSDVLIEKLSGDALPSEYGGSSTLCDIHEFSQY